MGKFKRPKPVAPPKKELTWRERVEAFFQDWGRLAVPLGVVGLLALLRAAGILDDTGVGFVIGIIFVGAMVVSSGWIVRSQPFPKWVRAFFVGMAVLVLVGALVPLTELVYPGQAVFQAEVRAKGQATQSPDAPQPVVKLPSDLSGFYHMEIFAKDLASRLETRGVQGKYHLKVAGKDVSGQFSDVVQSVRGWRGRTKAVEYKHFMEVHGIVLPEGEKTLEAVRIDGSIGPVLQVSFFSVVVPPLVGYILLILSVFAAVLLDAWFPGQTERWRFSPWFCMVLAYLAIFESAYARGSVTNAAVWSVIFGGVLGFVVGWALSLIARKIAVRVRSS